MSKKVARIIKYLVQICLPVFTWPQHIWCQLTRTYSAERLKHTANMNCKTQTKLSINKNLTYVHEQLHTAQLGQKKKKTTLVKTTLQFTDLYISHSFTDEKIQDFPGPK